jgi:hypothetical protein
MRKFILIIFTFIVTVSAQAQTSEQAVIDLSKKKFTWMTQQQYDSLESVLDERLMFVHSNGWTEDKQEFIQDIKSGKLRYVQIDVLESTARVYTGTAIVTGKGKFKVLLEGNSLDINLFYTEVYILIDKKWLLASRHSNRLP